MDTFNPEATCCKCGCKKIESRYEKEKTKAYANAANKRISSLWGSLTSYILPNLERIKRICNVCGYCWYEAPIGNRGIATVGVDVQKDGIEDSIVLHDIKATHIDIDCYGVQQDSISLESHKRYRIEVTEEK